MSNSIKGWLTLNLDCTFLELHLILLNWIMNKKRLTPIYSKIHRQVERIIFFIDFKQLTLMKLMKNP